MAMQSIEELFAHEVKDVYAGEQAIVQALDQMAGESADREIKKAYTQHRKETQAQIRRLEKVFRLLGSKAEAEACPGIDGLVKEKKLFMREKPSRALLEFFNIGAAQKVERYEISAYENLIDMANKLAFYEAVALLEQSLQEEEAMLNRLKAIASEFEAADEGNGRQAGEEPEEAPARR